MELLYKQKLDLLFFFNKKNLWIFFYLCVLIIFIVLLQFTYEKQ